jgi:YD repeat-containing protein
MKQYIKIFAGCLVVVLCINSITWADSESTGGGTLSPLSLSTKITRVMREYQARRIYCERLVNNEDGYQAWTSPSDCENLETPYYPPNDWYVYRIKESMDPEQKVIDIMNNCDDGAGNNLMSLFSELVNKFVHRECWELEDKPYYIEFREVMQECPFNFSNSTSWFLLDFPELCENGERITNFTLNKTNYIKVLDALYNYLVNDLIVVKESAGTESPDAPWGQRGGFGFSCSEAKSDGAFVWESEGGGLARIGVWTNSIEEIGCFSSCAAHRGRIASDFTKHTGHAKCFLQLRIGESNYFTFSGPQYPINLLYFSNTEQDGLKAQEEWQRWGNPSVGVEWKSDMLADFQPDISHHSCPLDWRDWYDDGWTLACETVLVWPDFKKEINDGIDRSEVDEQIFKMKMKEEDIVYSQNLKCEVTDGETVDGRYKLPWTDLTGTDDKLVAHVVLAPDEKDSEGNVVVKNIASAVQITIANKTLSKTNPFVCVSKSEMEITHNPPDPVVKYALPFSVKGLMGETKVEFEVYIWKQTGTGNGLQTQLLTDTVAFDVKENHYNCCAKEDCGVSCPIGTDWEKPTIEKMKNDDTQVTFPEAGDSGETYIFETPRPGFIKNVSLEQYDGSPSLVIKNSSGTVIDTLDSAVVLRYEGGLGLVYTVPSTWWTDVDELAEAYPEGSGIYKYLVYKEGLDNIYIEESDNSTNSYGNQDTTVTSATNPNVYTVYQRNNTNYPDRVTRIVYHDNTGGYNLERITEVSYDDDGNITEIGATNGGCSSCSSGGSDRVVQYDDDGNVIATFDKDDNPLYAFDYDGEGELISTWLGSKGDLNPVQEIIRTLFDTHTQIDTLDYTDENTYTLSRVIQDKAGRTWERTGYENTNVDPAAPFSRLYRMLYRYAPVQTSDPDLQAYWTFDDGSGGWVLDSSQFNRAGLFSSTSTSPNPWGTGIITLNGSYQEHLTVQGYKGIAGKQSRTICFWISSSASGPVASWGDGVSGQNWVVSVASGNVTVSVIDSGGSKTASASKSTGNHHIAIVLNNDSTPTMEEVKIYVDGVSKTVTASIPSFAVNTTLDGDLLIGSDGAAYFTGQLDNLIILDRALSTTEIKCLADNQLGIGDYEVHITIPPNGDSSGNGIRTESVTTYTGVNPRYITEQRQVQYGPTGSVEVSKTEYTAINGGEDTRISKSYSYGSLMTTYLYTDSGQPSPTETQVQDELQAAATQVAKQGQSSVTLQLARHYVYDSQGRIEKEYQYNRNGFTPYELFDPATDAFLTASCYIYDDLGNLESQYTLDGEHESTPVQITDYRYNGFKELYMTKSPTGVVTGTIYDDAGRTLSEFTFAHPKDAWDEITSYGQLLVECTDATLGNRPVVASLTYYTYYEDTGRLRFVQKAKVDNTFYYSTPAESGTTGVPWVKTDYTYDIYGRRGTVTQDADTSRTTPLTTTTVYDNQGRGYMTILPNGKYTKTNWNGRGQVQEQIVGYLTDPADLETEVPISVTQLKYDAAGNLKEQIYPDGSRVQNEYDGYGRLERVYKGVFPKD